MTEELNKGKYSTLTFSFPVICSAISSMAMMAIISIILIRMYYVPSHQGTPVATFIFKNGYTFMFAFVLIMMASAITMPVSLFLAFRHRKVNANATFMYRNLPLILTIVFQGTLLLGFIAIRLHP
ncbi:MAG: hypothetical protein RR272_04535 [Synergistaceae bacterium]